jgi:flagellar biosynthetic protein FliR
MQILLDVGRNFDYFLLMMLRVSALIISSPIFGRKNIPNMAKIGLCLVLTYVIFAGHPMTEPIAYRGLLEFAVLCLKELLFGLVLGYVTTLFFSVVQTAGYIIDTQVGFGMVSVLDTQTGTAVPVTGNFLYVVLMVCFFGVNAHHQLIRILSATVESIPIGQVTLRAELGTTALRVFAMAFVLAVNVAMPVVAAGLLGEVIMGVVVRTVPQMNIFVVGIPLKIILGLLALIAMLPIYVAFTGTIFESMFDGIAGMFQTLGAT